MGDDLEPTIREQTKRSKGLLIASTVYGLLYSWFVIGYVVVWRSKLIGGAIFSSTLQNQFHAELSYVA